MSGPVLQFATCESGPSNPCNPSIRYAGATAGDCSNSILPDMAAWCNNFDFDAEGTAWGDNAAAVFNDCNSDPDSVVTSGGEVTGSGGYGFGSSLISPVGLSYTGALTIYRAQIWCPAGVQFGVIEYIPTVPYPSGPAEGFCGNAVLNACTGSVAGAPCSGGIIELYVPDPSDIASYTPGCGNADIGFPLYYFLFFIPSGFASVAAAIAAIFPAFPEANSLEGYGPSYTSGACFAAPDDAIYGTGGGYP